jgi:hypothetical protein
LRLSSSEAPKPPARPPAPADSDLKKHAQSKANLVAYRKRIRERWWTDLPALP